VGAEAALCLGRFWVVSLISSWGGSLDALGTLTRTGSLTLLGTLFYDGSLIIDGTLEIPGSLAQLGALVWPGSLMDNGTLNFRGSLTIAGTLMYYGYGRGPCRHKLTARLVSSPTRSGESAHSNYAARNGIYYLSQRSAVKRWLIRR
jgi:hypothetical protein